MLTKYIIISKYKCVFSTNYWNEIFKKYIIKKIFKKFKNSRECYKIDKSI